MTGKKKIIFIVSCALLFMTGWAFFRSRQGTSGQMIRELERDSFVHGVNEYFPAYCITDGGILFAYRSNIRYLELSTGEEYVLCDRPNCMHLSRNCGGYYSSDEMDGLVLYQGYVYRFEKNMERNVFELIRTNAAGNDRKVIAVFDIGNYENQTWYLRSVENTNYNNGVAWTQLQYYYVRENGELYMCGQCVGIDLNTGNITEITPLEEAEYDFNLMGITDDWLFFRKDWVDENGVEMTSWMRYDIASETLVTLEETPKWVLEDEYGRFLPAKYTVIGEYEGGLLCQETKWETDWRERWPAQDQKLFLWDVEKNERQDLYMLENAEVMRMNEDMIHDAVTDGTYLLYYFYSGNGRKEARKLDLVTGEWQKLFEVDAEWYYSIAADTSDEKNFLLVYVNEDGGEELYCISKEDYYSGNLDAMMLLREFPMAL